MIYAEITKDHLWCVGDAIPSRVGQQFTTYDTIRTAGMVFDMIEEPDALDLTKQVQFKLYDDDGELYYEGWLYDDPYAQAQSAVLRWGEIDAGCTTIKVRIGNEWKQEVG